MSNGFELCLSGRRRPHPPHSTPKEALDTNLYLFRLLGDRYDTQDKRGKKRVELVD